MATERLRSRNESSARVYENGIKRYFTQISQNTSLSTDEEAELSERIRQGDMAAFKKLVLANLRFVVGVAQSYVNQGLPLADLIDAGNIGLMRAAKKFDGRKKYRFISYAVWWIRQEILLELAEQSRLVRLPINRIMSLIKIERTRKVIQQRMHNTPTAQDIADELGMPAREIDDLLQTAARPWSVDAPVDEGSGTLLDILPSPGSSPAELVASSDMDQEIGKMLSGLDSKEREILQLYFGIGYEIGSSYAEIGRRYSLSSERVRQIKEQAVRKLRKVSRSGRVRELYKQ